MPMKLSMPLMYAGNPREAADQVVAYVRGRHDFAIGVAGRGFDARISTELDTPLTDSACVFCGNCVGVCPTGALFENAGVPFHAAASWNRSPLMLGSASSISR